jgi:hypothetical protein
LSWDPAAVQLPQVPLLPPGEDAMSATIAGVLPTLATPLVADVAALSAKEGMFSGKLVSAQAAYQNADDSGQQSLGQLVGMLGQVGQLGQAAGAPAQSLGGQSGMFGSLMQPVMQAVQGAGGGGGATGGSSPGAAAQNAGGQSIGGSGLAGGGSQQAREGGGNPGQDAGRHEQRDAQPNEHRREPALTPPDGVAGPDNSRHSAGPVPVTPPEHPRHGGNDDLARRM